MKKTYTSFELYKGDFIWTMTLNETNKYLNYDILLKNMILFLICSDVAVFLYLTISFCNAP